MRKKILFFLIISVLSISAQTLPHYKLTIAPSNLDSMYAHPEDETYFPAIFQVDTFSYAVQARFKGSTTLLYPKKSWAIKFDNANNYFGKSRINLHADYKDYSNMRNFLILNLFDYLGSPSSKIQHVTYEVNNEPYGIYTQTEQIDKEYLSRYGRTPLTLYKATNHGALMAPAVHDEYYGVIWQMEGGNDPEYNELRGFMNKCMYWSRADFDANIGNLIDVDNFLNFFAVHFVFVGMDNFTKNIYLNKNSNSLKYELFPWDNEGTFANSAIGVFDSTLVDYNMRDAHTPEYEVIFQRLLENPAYRYAFKTKVNKIITNGFTFMDTLIDNTYLKIKQDVYADTKKEASNADFDNSIPRLKWFLNHRKTFLQNNALPIRNVLTDFYCSNPLPTPANSSITFRLTSPVTQPVNMFFADSVNFNRFGQGFKFSRFQLYDDGKHDDLLANDLIYGNTIDANKFVSPLIPFAITGAEQNYPTNGIFFIDYYGSKSYAINKGNVVSDIDKRLSISKVFKYENNYFVELINTSDSVPVDLSYCHLRSDDPTHDFMFTDQVVLEPNDTVYVSSNYNLGNQFFNGKRSFYNLYYSLAVGDSLHLLSPMLTNLVSTQVDSIQTLTVHSPGLVINEINYKSGASKPAGDWVEIYNPESTTVDLSGWIFKDSDNKHAYAFPYGYLLRPDDYVVVSEKLTDFQTTYPDMNNVIGSFGFGLSSSGEPVRLYDNLGQLVDSVYYTSSSPWPVQAAGTGATLELKSPAFDNAIAGNWYANSLLTGTPGSLNSFVSGVDKVNTTLLGIYPNPATGKFYLQTETKEALVEVISLQGSVLKSVLLSFGLHSVNVSDLSSGMYLVRVTVDGKQMTEKLIIR